MKKFKVALLGTGLMGYGMAANIAKAGFETHVWNRTPEKAFDLRNYGVVVAETVTDSVRDADIVLTMVIDSHAVAEVMTLALPAMKKDAIWIQSSTVGIEGQTKLSSLAKDFGISFIDAPVLGSKDAADNGSLIALAAGEDLAIEQVTPVLDSFSSRIMKMGEDINDAQRLKLVMQSWALSITAATGQAFALAQNLGTSPEKFLEAIKGGAQDCPYAHLKGKAIQQEQFDPAFTLDGAVKDAGLIIDAMKLSGTGSDVMEAIQKNYLHAAKNFSGREDMGAIFKSFKTSH